MQRITPRQDKFNCRAIARMFMYSASDRRRLLFAATPEQRAVFVSAHLRKVLLWIVGLAVAVALLGFLRA